MLINHVFVYVHVHCLDAAGFNEECLQNNWVSCVSDGAGVMLGKNWCGNQADCKVPCPLHMALYEPWFWRFTISTVSPQSSGTCWRQHNQWDHIILKIGLSFKYVMGGQQLPCCKSRNVCVTLDTRRSTRRIHCLNLQSCLQNFRPIRSNHTFESRPASEAQHPSGGVIQRLSRREIRGDIGTFWAKEVCRSTTQAGRQNTPQMPEYKYI